MPLVILVLNGRSRYDLVMHIDGVCSETNSLSFVLRTAFVAVLRVLELRPLVVGVDRFFGFLRRAARGRFLLGQSSSFVHRFDEKVENTLGVFRVASCGG